MRFGPKLDPPPLLCFPGDEIPVTLIFLADDEDWKRDVDIYVEEPTGLRTIKVTVKSATRGSEP